MKFKKFKARKSNKRNGLKKAVNVALIIKVAVSALALLTVLGVVGSMFSGSSSGSSGGGSTVRPSRPGTSAPDTEQTEETTPDTPELPVDPSDKSAISADNFNVYVGPEDLQAVLDHEILGEKLAYGNGVSYVTNDINQVKYVRIYGDGESAEAKAYVHNFENQVTGQYLVFAYRIPEGNVNDDDYFEVYVTSHGRDITGENDRFYMNVVKDGEWHVSVVDMADAVRTCPRNYTGGAGFEPSDDGTYTISKLRFDWFNRVTPTDNYIDVAYIGVTDSIYAARHSDPDYTGFEFTAEYVKSVIDSMKNNEAEISCTKNCEGELEYYTLTSSNVPSNGETRLYLNYLDAQDRYLKIIPGAERYIGIMYRNAPEGYAEIFANSGGAVTTAGYYASGSQDYVQGSEWQLMIFDLWGVSETVIRSLRLDFSNNQNPGETVSLDIAFMKFFDSSEAANEYYQAYLNTYNLNK